MAGITLAPLTETGTIPLHGLKHVWSKALSGAASSTSDARRDHLVLSVAGIGLEEAIVHLYSKRPSFEAFEQWIVDCNGGALDLDAMARFNRALAGDTPDDHEPQVLSLSPEELSHFDAHGYVVLRSALTPEHAGACADLLWQTIDATPGDPQSWDRPHPLRQNIMVQRFRGEPLEMNRRNPRIRGAFEQLYRRDIWPLVDRLGFNPPTPPDRVAAPARLHWDADLTQPVPFLLQGLIYLNDVAEDQGAFSCVPGFQHRLEDWLRSLPPGSDPQAQDLDALGRVHIPGHAGDMVIWHQALPHGASRNASDKPRLVQYLTYQPLSLEQSGSGGVRL